MTVTRLTTRRVEKPWGRHDLLPAFGDVPANEEPVGEIWFEDPRGTDPDLLVKYLFTSEKLSVQVHPSDEEAQARGLKRGKEEAWLVLEAAPDATIGLGLKEKTDAATLRAASEDGRIEDMLDWKKVKAGDYFYSPAGTVHALGPGLKLIEVQQNIDLTYRLYDYGRPRELHLDDGVAVSRPAPYEAPFEPYRLSPNREILAAGRKFVLERWTGQMSGTLHASPERQVWIVAITDSGNIEGQVLAAGGVWIAEGNASIETVDGADLLISYDAREPFADLLGAAVE
jgi:mannose-6-phosphate isomerase